MVTIIADTTSGIPPDEAAKRKIQYIPQIIVFGEKTYRDDNEMNSQQFLQMLASSPTLPKTAAPPPALYTPILKAASDEHDSVIVICPSADLSGTYRSATVASQEFPDLDIRIIDTRTIAGGLGQIVIQAQKWADEGLDADTIETKVKAMSAREQVYFIVDTLEYLHKGGRIGGASALFGSILQVKPILSLRDGKSEPVESQRTKQRALARIKELVTASYPSTEEGYLSVSHGNAEADAKRLADDLAKVFNLTDVPIFNLPPAILVHAGPGTLSVSFFKKN